MDNDSINEKTLRDVHTKEIDLVNRDPKHLNDDVVKVSHSAKLFCYMQLFLSWQVTLIIIKDLEMDSFVSARNSVRNMKQVHKM